LIRLIALLLILTVNNLAGQEIKKINSERSNISYTGSHFLHKWSADNTNISGLVQIDEESILNIGVVAKVTDFKSGNSSLDSNSFKALEALKFPNIVFKSTEIKEINDKIIINGLIEFHGIEASIKLEADLVQVAGLKNLTGEFSLSLTDFLIDPPSLLLRKIDDEISIKFDIFY